MGDIADQTAATTTTTTPTVRPDSIAPDFDISSRSSATGQWLLSKSNDESNAIASSSSLLGDMPPQALLTRHVSWGGRHMDEEDQGQLIDNQPVDSPIEDQPLGRTILGFVQSSNKTNLRTLNPLAPEFEPGLRKWPKGNT